MRTNSLLYPLAVCLPGASAAFDEYGEPVVDVPVPDTPDPRYGEAVECWAEANTDDAMGVYEDGEFRRCAYTALVQKPFPAALARLVRDGEDVGVFRVSQTQNLKRMGRVRLVLRQ